LKTRAVVSGTPTYVICEKMKERRGEKRREEKNVMNIGKINEQKKSNQSKRVMNKDDKERERERERNMCRYDM